MKIYSFPFDAIQAELIFEPIRSKTHVIGLLMRALKHMLVNATPAPEDRVGEIVLIVSKMSRLFFVRENQITSIAFPFAALEVEGALRFRSPYHPSIDNRVTSAVLGLLAANEVFESQDVIEFADRIDQDAEGDSSLWGLFRQLFLEEDGYLRYDHDPKRINGHLHPLHHVDIFYSSRATFKLGSHVGIDVEMLREILNLSTDCYYVDLAR